MKIPTVLSIAGSDPCGGAGIQGDIKTIFAEGCYGMGAISGLTVQNTMGVSDIMPVPADFLYRQIDKVLSDIRPDAIKIGMIVSSGQIDAIVELIKQYGLENVILDPVVAPTRGVEFASLEVMKCMIEKLFPLSMLVTPNLPEAKRIHEIIEGYNSHGEDRCLTIIRSKSLVEIQGKTVNPSAPELACFIGKSCGCNVLVKGGHSEGCGATDHLWIDGGGDKVDHFAEFKGERIEALGSHGTGCALSSSIAANIAKGYALEEAIDRGKKYVTAALKSDMRIGTGNGSVDHGAFARQ